MTSQGEILSMNGSDAPHACGVDEPQRLRAARHSRDLTQTALASKAGVDQTAISKAETGRLRLEDSTLARVADVLGVSVVWLRRGEGVGPVPADSPVEPTPGSGAWEAALEEAFDKNAGHRLTDVDAVRKAFGGQTFTLHATPSELARVARRVLDAAACARHQGAPVTMAEILVRALMYGHVPQKVVRIRQFLRLPLTPRSLRA